MKSRISVFYSEETRVRFFILSEESATVTEHHKGVIEVTEEEQGLESLRSIAFRLQRALHVLLIDLVTAQCSCRPTEWDTMS